MPSSVQANLLKKIPLSLSFLSFIATILLFLPPNKTSDPLAEVKAASVSIPEIQIPILSDPPPQNSALAIAIFDPDSKQFIYEQNIYDRRAPASLTKLMTALVSYQSFSLDQIFTIQSAHNSIGHSVNFVKYDQLSVYDLLKALLISSGNDAALTLAENYPGGYTNFILTMNEKALKLGLNNTNFVNASGLDETNHFSSAYDLTLLASQIISLPILNKIIATNSDIIYSAQNSNKYYLATTNQLLGKDGVVGIKTGWTEQAGENLITLTERNSHRLIITVLGSQDRFADSETLINWAFENTAWN